MGIVFSISNYVINKISHGRKYVRDLAAAIYLYLLTQCHQICIQSTFKISTTLSLGPKKDISLKTHAMIWRMPYSYLNIIQILYHQYLSAVIWCKHTDRFLMHFLLYSISGLKVVESCYYLENGPKKVERGLRNIHLKLLEYMCSITMLRMYILEL